MRSVRLFSGHLLAFLTATLYRIHFTDALNRVEEDARSQRGARKHQLASGTSFTPVNGYDQYMIMQVFSEYLEAAKILGREDDEFVGQVAKLLPKVYRPRIGDDGRLMEWRLPFAEPRPGHRHISHVLGAYPGNQINLDEDADFRAAVRKTLETRLRHGGAATGWSRAWTIGIFARLSDAKEAYNNLIAILDRSTLDNLWDNHPPFQIDGNFGATAAVAEMLLHSHNDEIKLLPALPAEWQDGHIKGLRARGDYTVDIVWREGTLCQARITAGDNAAAGPVKVVYAGNALIAELTPGASTTIHWPSVSCLQSFKHSFRSFFHDTQKNLCRAFGLSSLAAIDVFSKLLCIYRRVHQMPSLRNISSASLHTTRSRPASESANVPLVVGAGTTTSKGSPSRNSTINQQASEANTPTRAFTVHP